MSESKHEEMIAALWAICSLLAFGAGYEMWGWVFAVKASADTICSIGMAIKEWRVGK